MSLFRTRYPTLERLVTLSASLIHIIMLFLQQDILRDQLFNIN